MHFQGSTAECECVIETSLDFNVEPGIDALVDKLDGEPENHQQRQHGQAHEHADHPGFEFRPRYMIAVVAQKPRKVANHEGEQNQDAGDVDQQDNDVQAIEVFRGCRSLAQEV